MSEYRRNGKRRILKIAHIEETTIKKIHYIRFFSEEGSKYFSVKKYGYNQARFKAEEMLRKYNEANPQEREHKPFQKPTKRSKSGIVGVFYSEQKHRNTVKKYWIASIYIQKKEQIKKFNADILGFDEARTLAIKQREEWESRYKDEE